MHRAQFSMVRFPMVRIMCIVRRKWEKDPQGLGISTVLIPVSERLPRSPDPPEPVELLQEVREKSRGLQTWRAVSNHRGAPLQPV